MVTRTNQRKLLIQEEEDAYRYSAYALKNPRLEMTVRGYPFWDTHPASKLLEKDYADGTVDAIVSKKALWLSRPEYLEFPLDVFRYHYYQGRRKQMAGAHWQLKRNIVAQQTHDKEVISMKDEYGPATWRKK